MPSDDAKPDNRVGKETSIDSDAIAAKIGDRPSTGPRDGGVTKISANFTQRSLAALEITTKVTGSGQGEVLNRSVQLYAYLIKAIEAGDLIFIENPQTGVRDRLIPL